MRNLAILVAALAWAVSSPLFAQQRMANPAADDLVPARVANAPDPGFTAERAPVHFAWRIDASQPLEAPEPFVAESREFWAEVDDAELHRGYRINTTRPGALVRISPRQAGGPADTLELQDFELEVRGRRLPAAQALDQAASPAQLRAAGLGFPEGSIAFRLRPEQGAGAMTLRTDRARGRYLVHVFEPDSPLRLRVGNDRDAVVAGGRLRVDAQLLDGDRPLRARRVGGLVTAPDGRSIELRFRNGRDGLSAEAQLPSDAAATPGLWEVHTFAVVDTPEGQVLRDAKTAVAVAAPTARLSGSYGVQAGEGVRVAVGVQVGAEGRYEVRGVLYGTDGRGELRPVAVGHSAAWLGRGDGEIVLQFGPDVLNTGLGEPYAIRDLSLSDQSRMGRLEHRARGPEGLRPRR